MNADFFVLRVPMLSLDELEHSSDDLAAPAALAGGDEEALGAALAEDRARGRDWLSARLRDPQIAEAMRLASPGLFAGLRRWTEDPDGPRGRSAERSLMGYLARMCARPALFGTFAAYAVGELTPDGPTSLRVAGRGELRVRAQLDIGLLHDVINAAIRDAEASDELLVRRDPGLYEAAGELRLATRRREGTRLEKRRIIALRPTPAVRAVLDAAARPTATGTLIALAEHHEPTARATVTRLLETGALQPATSLPSTGSGATAQAIASLREIPGGRRAAEAVSRAAGHLTTASERGLAEAERELRQGGIATPARGLVHVDAVRPAELRLPTAVTRELRRAVELLARVAPAEENRALVQFRGDFERRYGTRAVPLLEAVDPDCGVVLHDDPSLEEPPLSTVLLELIERGHDSGEAELSDADVTALETASAREPLPDAFALTAMLRAESASAIDRGEFSMVEPSLSGPSGARMLGRLCDGDPELTRRVAMHLRAEEACRPEALFAELVSTPDTEWGATVSYRPVLREWEIECGAPSGAAPDQRLEASDLLLALEDGELVVHSQRLGRRLLPRASAAVNHVWVSLPAVRLLRLLEEQRCAGHLRWSWGSAAGAPRLPRIRRGRIILTRRRWSLPIDGLPPPGSRCDPAGYRAVEDWRRAHGLPVRVAVQGGKGELAGDFRAVLGVEAFLAALKGSPRAHLVELAGAHESPVEGPDGRYAHEIIVPFVMDRRVLRASSPRTAAVTATTSERRFAPGSEWLYAKLYGPPATAEAVLRHVIAALEREVGLGRWFFVRFADPDRHLRLRFQGEPRALCSEVLPALHEATGPALRDGRLHRLTLDTYEREVERYGGIRGVELMERAAHADSVAVLAMLADRAGGISRRLLAVASVGALLADAGLEVGEREEMCAGARARRTPPGSSLPELLGSAERAERPAVERVLEAVENGAHDEMPAALGALRRRSDALREVVAELGNLELGQPLTAVLASLAHMQINRVLRESGGLEELRVHDALARAYHARRVRLSGSRE